MLSRARSTLCTLLLALGSTPAVAQELDDDLITLRPREGYESVRVSKNRLEPDKDIIELKGEPMPFDDMRLTPSIPVDPIRVDLLDKTVYAGSVLLEEGVDVDPYLSCNRNPHDLPFNHLLERGIADLTPFRTKKIYRRDVWSEPGTRLDDSYTYCRYGCFAPPNLTRDKLFFMEPAQQIADVARWVKDHPDEVGTIPRVKINGNDYLGFRNQWLPVTNFSKTITDQDGNTIQVTYWDRNSCLWDSRTNAEGADGIYGPHDALEVAVFSPSGIKHFVDHHLNGFLYGNVHRSWDASKIIMKSEGESDVGEIADGDGRNIVFKLKEEPAPEYPENQWWNEYRRQERQEEETFFENEYRDIVHRIRGIAGLRDISLFSK